MTKCRGYSIVDVGGVKNIDINSSSFDGYVIPNGATYKCAANDFKDACRLYAPSHSENSTTFTVPDLAGFFKGNPAKQTTDAMQLVPH